MYISGQDQCDEDASFAYGGIPGATLYLRRRKLNMASRLFDLLRGGNGGFCAGPRQGVFILLPISGRHFWGLDLLLLQTGSPVLLLSGPTKVKWDFLFYFVGYRSD